MLIAFRLKPGRDDDLIAWISSLGQDERSYNIRRALRGSLEGPALVQVKPAKVEPMKPAGPQEADAADIEKNLDGWL